MSKQLKLEDLNAHRSLPNGGSMPKVAIYGWKALGQMGVFEMIDKNLIEVDEQYQRDLKIDKAVKIARGFDWTVFGAITVNRRPDGTYKCIEGQHRVGGAMLRDDITHLPCLVFQLAGVEDEAAAFDDINSTRAGLSGLQRWKAKIIMGDEDTVIINSMILESGLAVGTGKNDVKCVGALLDQYRRGREAMQTVWPILVRLCAGDNITEAEVKGLCWVERNAAEDYTLAEAHWNRALIPSNLDQVRNMIRQQRGIAAGEASAGRGVHLFINRGRQNRFKLKEGVLEG